MRISVFLDYFWRFTRSLKRVDIRVLVFTPIAISITLIIGWLFIADRLFKSIPESYTAVVGAFSMFISSLSGFAQVVRKESPGLLGIPFVGTLPVLAGLLWMIFCWLLGALLIYLALAK
jgi:hypothetical protein